MYKFFVFNERTRIEAWCRDSHGVIDTLWDMHPRQGTLEQAKALTLFVEDAKPGQIFHYNHILIIRLEST